MRGETQPQVPGAPNAPGTPGAAGKKPSGKKKGQGVQIVAGPEDGMQKFGNKDGTIDCMYTWMVKRDVFNIPMMIVVNVSHPAMILAGGLGLLTSCSLCPFCDGLWHGVAFGERLHSGMQEMVD